MSVRERQPVEIERGDRSRFGVRISFAPDPDPEYVADEGERSSWGELALWVDGKNITRNAAFGEEREGCQWYLLTLLEMLAENWDPLLHEERLSGGIEEA